MAMGRTMEIRLIDSSAPAGEIDLTDLARIGGQLQELATRVSRWVAEIDGPGRGPRPVERAAQLRLVAVRGGSTVLTINAGPPDTLDFDTEFEEMVDEHLWAVLDGIQHDTPPAGTPSGVKQSALGLLDALREAAPRVELSGAARRETVRFAPAARNRDVWADTAPKSGPEEVSVSGRLEMIDSRSRRLRIVDDLGNRIALDDVADPIATAALLGARALVQGLPTRDQRGRLTTISAPTISAQEVPAGWDPSEVTEQGWRPPGHHVGPDPRGVVEIDDNEFDAFMAVVRSL